MNRTCLYLFTAIFCACTVMSPLPGSGASFLEDFAASTPVMPADEIRALWVVRHTLNSQDDIDRAVDFAVRARFHLLFVQVRGRGDAFYRSTLEPTAESLESPLDEFDPLDYLIARAHSAGIAVHAWVNVFYVWSDGGSNPPPGHIVERHPEWLVADRQGVRMDEQPVEMWNGRGIEGYYVAPADTAARRHTANVIKEIAERYAIDGIHLDYVRYPGLGYGQKADRTAFALRYGVDPAVVSGWGGHKTDGLSEQDVRFLDSLRVEWRADRVDSMVIAIRNAVPHLPLSAAVAADPDDARAIKGQDWIRWVHHGYVDFVVPMSYRYSPDGLTRLINRLRNAIGIGSFLVGLGVYDNLDQHLKAAVAAARAGGAAGVAVFSYNALAEMRFAQQFLDEVFFEAYREEPPPESDEE